MIDKTTYSTSWTFPNLFNVEKNTNNKLLILIGCIAISIFKGAPIMNAITSLVDRCISLGASLYKNLTSTDINHVNLLGWTPLTSACRSGDLKTVETLLKTNTIDVNKTTSQGDIPLIIASILGHTQIAQALLQSDSIDPNQTGLEGNTPLLFAILQGHLEIAEILLKNDKTDINKANNSGWTPLIAASYKGDLEAVKTLLKASQIDVNQTDLKGNTPLLFAIFQGHLEIAEILLKNDKTDVNKGNKSKCTPLIAASYKGDLEAVKILLKAIQIDVNQANLNGYTPLTAASILGHTQIAKELLQSDLIDPNQANLEGNTPLLFAIAQGHLEIAKILLKASQINVNQSGLNGYTALAYASAYDHLEILEILLKTDYIDINKPTTDGHTPLTLIFNSNTNAKMFEKLLEAGADVNQASHQGLTPLIYACYYGDSLLTQKLLEAGADIDHANSFGWTPIKYASEFGYPEIVKMLLQAKAEVNQIDPNDIPAASTWSFKGTQNGANGKVSTVEAESIRQILENRSPPGIIFNPTKTEDFCQGGTCSAMSLTLLEKYLKMQKTHLESSDHTPEILTKWTNDVGVELTSSSEIMRTRQVAYNTIEVIKTSDEIDFAKNKIQALANYHNLSINHYSKEMDIKELFNQPEASLEMEALPEGAYLVRMTKPKDNEKLEDFGHSFVYIKSKELNLFYDPNQGMRDLKELTHASVLFPYFKHYFIERELTKLRFYKLKENN